MFALATACSSSGSSPDRSEPGGKITVFAASSLTDAFNEIGDAFESKHPEAEITFNFAGTPTLRTQLEQGARADVFASANEDQMRIAIESGVTAGEPSVFTTNRLVVITPVQSPQVTSLADLAGDDVLLVLALPTVPVGGYARDALANLSGFEGLPDDFTVKALANLASEETNVRQVVAKVTLGEADAGIVYSSDITSGTAPRVSRIEIPSSANVIADYPIAITDDSGNSITGRAFVDFVLSPEGQSIMAKHGFGALSG